MLRVQIKTELPENCALGAIMEITKEAVMEVEGFAKIEDRIKSLVSFKAKKVKDIVDNLPSFCEGVVVSRDEAKVLIREHTCLISYPILESGCIINRVEVDEGSIMWDVICDDESFVKLIRELESYEVEFEIVYKGGIEGESEITYREEEVLRIALEKGYFDFPKKIKLEELAAYFNIAPSTLSEILRRGQKKILEKYFKNSI